MDRRQVFAVLVLNELGIEPKVDTFSQRLTVQKALYLSQAIGVQLGYFYGWYLRGPYCPAATRDLFAATLEPEEVANVPNAWTLEKSLKQRLGRMKQAIERALSQPRPAGDHGEYRARHLELLASVHFLVDRSGLPHHATQKIVDTLRKYNKNYTAQDVRNATRSLASLEIHPFAAPADRGRRHPRVD